MSQELTIKGVGYGISFTELTDKQLQKLLNEIEECDDVTEIELVMDLMDESFYEYGFVLGDEYLSLYVDEENESDSLQGVLESTDGSATTMMPKDGVNWLVYEAKEYVNSTIEVDEFDVSKFSSSKKTLQLPNEDQKTIVSIYYDDMEFEAWDTTSHGRVYVVTKERKIIDF